MKTIIFGGSFDPIHNGHIELAKTALKAINADRVVFMLAKNPRWKENVTPDIHRLNMLNIALKEYNNFEVSRIELELENEVTYTYETMLRFPKSEDEEIFFLIGYDQLDKLDKWYKIDELSKLVRFICIKRPNYHLDNQNSIKYNCIIIDEEVSNMSSTSFRKLIDVDVPKEVLNYVVDNNLYFIPKIKSYISEKRFIHTISVASLAYHMAINNNISPSKAYIAGLLHDIGKYVEITIQKSIAEKYELNYYQLLPSELYHQYTSVEIAVNDFNINDDEILGAIQYHATGRPNMSKLAKIIYCSDKIDPSRGYNSQDMINECFKDIDSGFNYVLSENIKYFKLHNINYDNPLTNACIKYYLG